MFACLYISNQALVDTDPKMSKQETNQTEQEKTTDFLKEEYTKRVDEVDNFSKRVFNMYGQVSTEFLYGLLNTLQHGLELQNKVSSQYGNLLLPQFMLSIVKQNTNTWIDFLQNIDTVYIESLKDLKNSVRAINNNAVLCIQSIERGLCGFENIQPNIKNEQESKTLQKQSNSSIEKIKPKNQ
jgi:hypothetical protein